MYYQNFFGRKVKRFAFLLVTMLFAIQASAQSIVVTGTVSDQYGPIIGAYVFVKNTNNGATTDIEGKYSIEVPANAILEYTYVGYKSQSIPVNGRTVINVVMQEDSEMLDDVVVVGFGTQTKANLTGAVATVDTKDMETRPITDLNQGLQGVSPGLTIMYSSGQLGGAPTINVRGTGTIIDGAASGSPLVLVDGIPTSLEFVNPDDVESISVLKDAASASIYGARAAFGVVLITTKKGEKFDKLKFSYTGSMGFSRGTEYLEHMEPLKELNAIIETAAARGDVSESWGAYHTVTIKGVQKWYDNYASKRKWNDLEMVYGEDWENVNGTTYFYRVWDVNKLMYDNAAPTTNHSFNVNGKIGNNTSLMASLGYNYRKGLMKMNPEEMQRYNASININTKLSKWLTADIRMMASRQDYQEPFNYNASGGFSGGGNNGYFGHIYRYGAYAPYGTYKGISFGFPAIMLREANTNLRRTDYLRLSLGLKAQVTKEITLNAEYSVGQQYMNWTMNGGILNLWRYQGAMVDPNGTPTAIQSVGSAYDAVRVVNSNETTNVFNAYARFNKKFKDVHNVTAQVGINTEWETFKRTYSERSNLLDPTKPEFVLATGTEYSVSTSGSFRPAHTEYSIAGVFGRLNYDYKGKYLVEFNLRYDGSSKFPTHSQWGVFPSGSIGWRVSEEPFMKSAKKVLNNLKLRASAGTIGNQRIRDNAFEPIMSSSQAYWLGNGSSVRNTSYGLPSTTSESLTWEKVTTFDVGIDVGLWRMINITADWYQRNTSGMLAAGEALPEVFGADAPLTNAGDLRTRGYEIDLSFNKVINENISVNASVGFSDSKSVVTKWNSAGVLGSMYEGMTVGEIWGLTTDRLIQESDIVNGQLNPSLPDQSLLVKSTFKFGAGDVLYKDLDGDGKITGGKGTKEDHGDLSIIGYSRPRYEYNFRLGGNFYGFDVNLFFQGVGRRDIAGTSSDVFMPFQRGYYDLLYAHQDDYWTPKNTDAYYPRLWRYSGSTALTGVYGSNNSITQTRYLINMAYLRLKNLTVGYTIPKKVTSKINVDRIRVYFSGENLLTFKDKHLPVDPEVTQTEHMLGRSFPLLRTLSFGVQATF